VNFQLVEILSYAIGIAAIIGLVRIFSVDKIYYPLIFLAWLGLTGEIVNSIVIHHHHSNALNDNIYSLLESITLLWIFRNWGLFKKRPQFFIYYLVFYIIAWITVNFFISSIRTFNSYFNILYAFITVLMAIHLINKLIVSGQKKLYRSTIFLACIGFVIFFTYKAMVEIFWVWGLNGSVPFRLKVYRIMTFINLAVNLIYALAILWIPRKREYTLLSS